jgi:hypothetical protein
VVVGRDIGEQRAAAGVGLDHIAHATHDHVAGKHRAFGAVGEGQRQHAPILDVDGIALDEGVILRRQTGGDIADVGRHRRDRNLFAARLRLHLLEIKHGPTAGGIPCG